MVVDVAGPESYWVRLDGSGRLTKRKRIHLKLIYPFLKQMEKVGMSDAKNSEKEASVEVPFKLMSTRHEQQKIYETRNSNDGKNQELRRSSRLSKPNPRGEGR